METPKITFRHVEERLARRAAVRLATFTPLTISGRTAVIHLSRKRHALIDLSDWEYVAGFMWTLMGPTRNGRFYAYRTTKNDGAILLHRFITKASETEQVDHWNNNGLDNRRQNLRRCDQPSNLANSNQRGREGLKGTYYDKARGLWQAHIQCRGKARHLGRFKTQREAADAYDKAARELFGEFALTNEEVRERSKSH